MHLFLHCSKVKLNIIVGMGVCRSALWESSIGKEAFYCVQQVRNTSVRFADCFEFLGK